MPQAPKAGTKTGTALEASGITGAERPAGSQVAVQGASSALLKSSATRELFASMAGMVPTSGDDGAELIVLAILGAKSFDELDAPWNSAKSEELVGVEVAIGEITRHESTYADGLGIFLVVRGKRIDTGEDVAYSTGSVSVVAQLVRAYALGAFPLYTILHKSDRPTAKGYYPLHLEILASGAETVPAQ
jgi:hypothetical protein